MLEQLAVFLGVKKAALLAGFFGAVISLRFIQEAKTWPTRIVMASCGTICAAYVTPGMADFLKTSERTEMAMAFAIGLFGMTIAGALMLAIRESRWGDALMTWLKRPGA